VPPNPSSYLMQQRRQACEIPQMKRKIIFDPY
jgi:hypothetical protein